MFSNIVDGKYRTEVEGAPVPQLYRKTFKSFKDAAIYAESVELLFFFSPQPIKVRMYNTATDERVAWKLPTRLGRWKNKT